MSRRNGRSKASGGNAFGRSNSTSNPVRPCTIVAPALLSEDVSATAVMATALSFDRSIALSVSADHLVGRYDLNVSTSKPLIPKTLSLF